MHDILLDIMQDLPPKISVQLKTIRAQKAISQRELAKQAHTTQAVISRIENENVNPSIGLLSRLSTALETNFELATKNLKKQLIGEYQTLNQIELSRSALLSNYRYFQSLNPGVSIAPVLKSNAYGHGLVHVGKLVDQNLKVPFICVDSLYEAYELEKNNVKTPILILGYTAPHNFTINKNLTHFHFPIFDLDSAKILNQHQPGSQIHLKIDTGMHRLGITPDQLPSFINALKKCTSLHVTGIYSHLSQADDPHNLAHTRNQIKCFKQAISQFETAGFTFRWKHLFATAAASYIHQSDFNLIRLGIGMYGISPFTQKSNIHKKLVTHLKPVLSLSTHIAQIKTVEAGSYISYGQTYRTQKSIKIGILPLGYYDGVDRRLSNQGFVRIKNRFCPIIGSVCMNLTIVDLSKADNVRVGERVEIFSTNTSFPNAVMTAARSIDATPYEILVNLSETTKRSINT